MNRKSTLTLILTLTGLVAATLGAYAFARSLNPEPFPTFSTTYYRAGVPIPFPVSKANVAGTLSGRIHSFAISPDLKTIAIATSKGVVLYDLQSYEQLRILGSKENSFSVAFSPDGKRLATGNLIMQNGEAGKPHLVAWDTSTWEVVFEPKIGNGDTTMFFGALAWSPNGNFLATSDYGRGLVTFDIKTAKVISLQEDFLLSPYDISWSPNGSRVVATGDLGYGFRRWRIDTDESVRLFDKRVDAAMQLAWSPDGKRIASAHTNGTVCFWTARTNQCDGMIQAHRSLVSSLAWSPDGSQLVTGGGILRIWDTYTGKMVTSFGLNPLGSIYSQLEWLADGTLVSLETGYAERELTIIRFWDIDTGEILMKVHGASGTFGE
jgi:WD40 repeat protein